MPFQDRSYFDTVSNKKAYEAWAKALWSERPVGIQDALHQRSTSAWGTLQLAACRVLVIKSRERSLPDFLCDEGTQSSIHELRRLLRPSSDHVSDSPETSRSRHCLQVLCNTRIANTPRSEHKHFWADANGGHIAYVWAALDRVRSEVAEPGVVFTNDDNDSNTERSIRTPNNPRVRPPLSSSPPVALVLPAPRRASARVAQAPKNPDFIASTNLRVDDSSSPTAATHSSPRSSLYMAGDAPNSASLPQYPETLTVNFISAFLREALPYLPPQNYADASPVVIMDDVPAAYTVTIGTIRYASRDDGGLRIVNDDTSIRIAALEAKRATSHSAEGRLTLPDDYFGQLVGEALAARLSDDAAWVGPDGCVIVMAAARHYLCFLTFVIPSAYIKQLRNHSLDDDQPFTEFMQVHSTCWFDLTDTDDRRSAVINLATVVVAARNHILGM
ncbi:hypothetical protein ColTof4_01154 [Colletotrichum tofieldiae]|nr:hypothetical protein ColTof3_08380 [Colletotrichum tofieldiae]GKT68731.1 hypothetical protein ColTof4_01154 [Colletotrichum tofieldiae]